MAFTVFIFMKRGRGRESSFYCVFVSWQYNPTVYYFWWNTRHHSPNTFISLFFCNQDEDDQLVAERNQDSFNAEEFSFVSPNRYMLRNNTCSNANNKEGKQEGNNLLWLFFVHENHRRGDNWGVVVRELKVQKTGTARKGRTGNMKGQRNTGGHMMANDPLFFSSIWSLSFRANHLEDPVARFVAVTRYFLSGWHIKPKVTYYQRTTKGGTLFNE